MLVEMWKDEKKYWTFSPRANLLFCLVFCGTVLAKQALYCLSQTASPPEQIFIGSVYLPLLQFPGSLGYRRIKGSLSFLGFMIFL
jgi:hypothetical protein